MDSTDLQPKDDELAQCLADAWAALEADDSATLTQRCQRALEIQENNPEAWLLLAKLGGWDSKMHVMDLDFVVDSAKHALELLPESQRFEAANDIYTARKKQIAALLEDEMMMPSWTGAKQLHQTMQDWLRILEETPYLSHDLLEGEITLVENLCQRSKMGIMPADRQVYVAYASLNGKVSYGQMFREALAARLAREEALQDAHRQEVLEELAHRRASYAEWAVSEDASNAARRERLEAELAQVEGEIENIVGQSGRSLLESQLAEMEKQKAKLGRFKVFHRRETDGQIAVVQAKLAKVDAELESATAPFREIAAQIKADLANLSHLSE